ncbi:MAG TPA: FAD-binding protein, partial [Candidatus Marinimicrobia bacterium]|nr:FAD-binding protein [Candidatus Neomarinimicrobiota bacterium]
MRGFRRLPNWRTRHRDRKARDIFAHVLQRRPTADDESSYRFQSAKFAESRQDLPHRRPLRGGKNKKDHQPRRVAVISREKLENSLLSIFNSEEIQTAKKGIPARLAVFPKSRDQLCELVTFATANGFTLIPLGSGSRLAGNGKYDLAVTTSHLDEQIEHSPADMVATIPAGASFSLTQSSLQKHGQRIPLDPQVE